MLLFLINVGGEVEQLARRNSKGIRKLADIDQRYVALSTFDAT